jgi:uncharacterized membrane protein HdeD (DUF308 family)
MVETLTKYWWLVVLRGALAVLFGLLALIWPGVTVLVLVFLFGAYALVDGAFALGIGLFGGARAAGRRGWLIVQGILGILAGIIAFAWPGATVLALLWIIAFWALFTGIMEIVTAIRLRREIEGEWLLILSGALSVLLGILLIAWPKAGILTVVFIAGIYALIAGVTLIVLGFRMRRLGRSGTVPGTPRPAPA